jgi:hypothetical protein
MPGGIDMDFWEYVTTWYNVIFLAPLLLVFLFAILQLVGAGLEIGGGASGGDVDIDADVDMDIDADLDVDSDVDVDADIGSEPGFISGALGFFNVGKVPLMVILMTWFASFGIIGLICNRIIGDRILGSIPPLAGVSFGVAFVVSLIFAKYFAAGIARIFPESSRGTCDQDLVGMSARVTSGHVTSRFGRAAVQTPDGYTITVSCRIKEGDEEPTQGDEVLITDYEPTTRMFEVIKIDTENL